MLPIPKKELEWAPTPLNLFFPQLFQFVPIDSPTPHVQEVTGDEASTPCPTNTGQGFRELGKSWE